MYKALALDLALDSIFKCCGYHALDGYFERCGIF